MTGFEALTGIPTTGLRAPRDTLFFSDLSYNLNQFALFGEGTLIARRRGSALTGGLRYYHFSEDKEQIFDGIFAQRQHRHRAGVAAGFHRRRRLRAARDRQLQADRRRAPECAGLARLPAGRHQRSAQRAAVHAAGPRHVRRPRHVGRRDRLELRGRRRSRGCSDGLGAFDVSAFYMDISDLQATVTAGSCSSRVVFNVPKARSTGFEVEFEAAPNSNFDFAVSASFNDSELRSTLTSTDASGGTTIVSGIEEGRRLPTVPRFQFAAAATYQWEVRPGALAYVTGTYQHIGSRFTQVGDEDLGTLEPAVVRRQHDWRPADGDHVHLRSRSCRPTTSSTCASGCAATLGRRRVHQQRHRRAGAPVLRPGARHARAHRLPDQPAAHLRHLDPVRFLTTGSAASGHRTSSEPLMEPSESVSLLRCPSRLLNRYSRARTGRRPRNEHDARDEHDASNCWRRGRRGHRDRLRWSWRR